MKGFRITSYKFEIMRRAAKKDSLPGLIRLLYKMVRSEFGVQHRPVFGLTASTYRNASRIQISGYQLELLTPQDEPTETLMSELSHYKQHIEWDIKTMLKQGGYVWIGRLNGQLATVALAKAGDKKEAYFFPLMPQSVVISHCTTFPPYRGLGLYPASLLYIIDVLAKEGFNRFYIDCDDWNIASVRGIQRAGFQLIGRGTVKNKKRLIWYQKSRPDFDYVDSHGEA